MAHRTAEIDRTTRETDITLALDLDGTGRPPRSAPASASSITCSTASPGTRRSTWTSDCEGDLHVDDHHSAEDVGICLGMAIDRALGDRAGIRRYGHAILPMDEALALCAVDLGGRPFVAWEAAMPTPKVGTFDTELVPEFWRSVATLGRMNLHVRLLSRREHAPRASRRSSRASPAPSATPGSPTPAAPACRRPRGASEPADRPPGRPVSPVRPPRRSA